MKFARLPGAIAVMAAVAACSSAQESHQPTPSPMPTASMSAVTGSDTAEAATRRSLIVDDAAAANPALVDAPLQVGAGFGVGAHTLKLPRGLGISVLAAGLDRPRFMAFDAAGNLLVAASGAGAIYRYPKGAGTARPPAPLVSGLDAPSSLAVHDGYLYVGEDSRVSRFRYTPTGPAGAAEAIVPNLPTAGHATKTVAFGPDGKLYMAMGSSCNICEESDERRAAILRYNPDGSGYERFAHGLRNAVGLAFQPGSGQLWATCNERDMQGNEIPPDLVTRVSAGQNFGWPDCRPPDATPQRAGKVCTGVTPPTVGIQAHSAPLGLAFASGGGFPAPYASGLFVAQHGSWNRQPPAAPKLLHIALDAAGNPTAVRIFATGWQDASGDRWGRPAGVLAAPDGALIVSDDAAGLLYRIAP